MKCFAILLLLLFCYAGNAQYKYDNVLYKTVYAEDLCKTLSQNPGFLLLDVRSKGEASDTSSSISLNIGHLSGATNISVRELGQRIGEISAYKDKPVFVYCSHSQRSRRASKMLADSGFTKVFNVNGGLTTLHRLAPEIDCGNTAIATSLPYKIITLSQLYNSKTHYSIIDIRQDSVFNGTSADDNKNAYGRLKRAVNIPFSTFPAAIRGIAQTKPVLLVDDFGDESPKAAQMLTDKGFKDVTVLMNGMDEVAAYNSKENKELQTIPAVPYHLITAEAFDKLMRAGKTVAIVDIRSKEEFSNTAKNSWKNTGNIKGALSLPYASLEQNPSSFNASKEVPVVIYSFSADDDNVFKTARLLTNQGYNNVNVLLGGIFSLRWRAANLKGMSALKDWVENIPEANF